MLSPLKKVVLFLVPVADKSIVPIVTAPVALLFTVPADTKVPLAFVKLATPSSDCTTDQPVTTEASAFAAAVAMIESPISSVAPEQ